MMARLYCYIEALSLPSSTKKQEQRCQELDPVPGQNFLDPRMLSHGDFVEYDLPLLLVCPLAVKKYSFKTITCK